MPQLNSELVSANCWRNARDDGSDADDQRLITESLATDTVGNIGAPIFHARLAQVSQISDRQVHLRADIAESVVAHEHEVIMLIAVTSATTISQARPARLLVLLVSKIGT
jgi:hypothetical protein